jgi:signal peptidase I
MNNKKEESNWEMIKSFLVAILIALIFRSLAYEPFHIPSGSMLSSLYEGDYIFVSKLSYGYSRYSFPFGIDFFEGRKIRHAPERGDVAVFRLPLNPRIDYIKRVIGWPGETIQMRHGRLYINGAIVEITRDGEVMLPSRTGEVKPFPRYIEKLPNGRTHVILDEVHEGVADNTPVFTVPEGHYFMMGDNRDNSQDSRYQDVVGFVPEENFVGRAELVLLSFNGEEAKIWQFWRWPQAFRNDRWFMDI